MRRPYLIAFTVIFLALCGAAAYRATQPYQITVDYPHSTLSEIGLFVCLRVGPLQRTRMAYYVTPLEFKSDLIAWKMRDDVKVMEVTE